MLRRKRRAFLPLGLEWLKMEWYENDKQREGFWMVTVGVETQSGAFSAIVDVTTFPGPIKPRCRRWR